MRSIAQYDLDFSMRMLTSADMRTTSIVIALTNIGYVMYTEVLNRKRGDIHTYKCMGVSANIEAGCGL